MFCKLPRTAPSAHLSLLPASSFRNLLLSLLLNRVTKRPVTDLAGKTQAVLPPSTVKRFLEANKLLHKEGHHDPLNLTCPLCETQDLSDRLHQQDDRGTGVLVHGELVRLGGPSAWSCCIPMHVRMPGTEWPSQTGPRAHFSVYLANSNEGGCEMNMLCCNLSLQEAGMINHLMQCVCCVLSMNVHSDMVRV